MFGIVRIRLFMGLLFSLHGVVFDRHDPRFTIEFKIDIPGPVFVHTTYSIELNDQGLSRLDINTDLITDIQSIEEDRGWQERGITVFLAKAVKLFEDSRIQDCREDVFVAHVMPELGFKLLFLGLKVNRLEQLTGTAT